jgi:hypothetical protein
VDRFSITADPDAIDASGGGLVELGDHLLTRAGEIRATPGQVPQSSWSGGARNAVMQEIEALGGQAARFGPMFTTAGQALKTLATTVRTAKTVTIPRLNERWNQAQADLRSATDKANAAFDQDARAVPAEVTGTARTATLQGLQQTRQNAIGTAEGVRKGAEDQLVKEFNTLLTELQDAFAKCGATLAASTVVEVKDGTVAAWVAGGGSGAMPSWVGPDGTTFPPALGARKEVGNHLALYDQRRGYEDGQRAAALGNKIKDPNHRPTQAELDELDQLMADNEGNKPFATEFMTGLGPRGLIELTGRVATLQLDDPADQKAGNKSWNEQLAKRVGSIQANLGKTLATATQQPGGENQLPPGWLYQLATEGRKKFTVGWEAETADGMQKFDVYGYQLIGVLLRSGTYSPEFLDVVGGDMVDFERTQKGKDGEKSGLWEDMEPALAARLNWIDGWDANDPAGFDPVAGLMVALKANPEGAKQFFLGVQASHTEDGKTVTRLPRLDYLLTDRTWPADWMETFTDTAADGYSSWTPPGLKDLGTVLVGATRDVTDQRSATIVESIVWEIGHDEQAEGWANGEAGEGRAEVFSKTDLVPPELREDLATIMVRWIPSVHGGMDGTGLQQGPDGDLDPYTPGVQTVMADLGQLELTRLLADLGKDPEARGMVVLAEANYALQAYRTEFGDPKGDPTQATYGASRVLGALDYGAAATRYNEAADADTKANDKAAQAQFVSTVVGAVAGALPFSPILGSIGGSYVGEFVGKLIAGPMDQDRTGSANAQVGTFLQSESQFLEKLAYQAYYENAKAAGTLPPELAGTPMNDWTEQQWRVWRDHVGSAARGDATDAGNGVNTAFTTTRELLEGRPPAKEGD